MKNNTVFICSPYRGDTKRNISKARQYARFAADVGRSPVVPHLLFPQFLEDTKADERIKGIELGIVQMKVCDEVWIFGTRISTGMEFEIEKAKEMRIPVRLFDEEMICIYPETLRIDDRVDVEYRKIVSGLRFAKGGI